MSKVDLFHCLHYWPFASYYVEQALHKVLAVMWLQDFSYFLFADECDPPMHQKKQIFGQDQDMLALWIF